MMIGLDSEIFLIDAGGQPVPVAGLLGGTKDNPLVVTGGFLQEDCTAAEIGIVPVDSAEDFSRHIDSVIAELQTRINVYRLGLSNVATMDFAPNRLRDKQSHTFGCDPDYNAWSDGKMNPIIDAMDVGGLRVAGGHIHVSWTEDTDHLTFIKLMDLHLGVPSVLLDTDRVRRKQYGRAGAFRRKSYPNGMEGVEYRSLSNFWLFDKGLREWVYNTSVKCLAMANEGFDEFETDSKSIQRVINTYSKRGAQRLIAKYDMDIPNAA